MKINDLLLFKKKVQNTLKVLLGVIFFSNFCFVISRLLRRENIFVVVNFSIFFPIIILKNGPKISTDLNFNITSIFPVNLVKLPPENGRKFPILVLLFTEDFFHFSKVFRKNNVYYIPGLMP